MTATLRRTEGLLSDGNRPQLAVKVWRSTLEQQEVVLPEHPGGSQAPDQLLQLLQQAERNGHGIAGVCQGTQVGGQVGGHVAGTRVQDGMSL